MHFQYGKKFNKASHHGLVDDMRARIMSASPSSKIKNGGLLEEAERQVGIYRALCELIDTGAVAALPTVAAAVPALVAALGERGPYALSERMDNAICLAKMDNTRDSILWLAANGSARSPVAGMSDMPKGADEPAGWNGVSGRFNYMACLRAVSWCGLAAKLDPTLAALAALEKSGIGAKDRERVFDDVSRWYPERESAVEACSMHHPWVAALTCKQSPFAADLLEKWLPKDQKSLSVAQDAAVLKSLGGESCEIEAVFKYLQENQVAIQSDSAREAMIAKYGWLLCQKSAPERRAAKAIESWLAAVPGQASDVEVASRLAERVASGLNVSEFEALSRAIGVIFMRGPEWATAEKPRGTRQQWRDLAGDVAGRAAALPAKIAASDSPTRIGFEEVLRSLDAVGQRLGKAEGSAPVASVKMRL